LQFEGDDNIVFVAVGFKYVPNFAHSFWAMRW
jgi:hypothetical protein